MRMRSAKLPARHHFIAVFGSLDPLEVFGQ